MVDWSSWLPGLPDDDPETEDPVTRTLATLGQGVQAVGSVVGQAAQGAGDAASAAGTTARGWLDDAIQGLPTLLPTPPATQPSYAPRRLEPGEPSMLEQLPAVASEYGRAAGEALGDRGSLLAGMRPPETPEEVVAAGAPAPFRAVRAISEIGSAAGSAALGEYAERAAGTDPSFVTNELETPLGTIPSVEGPTPRQIGSAVGSVVGDPTNLILPGTAADRAAGVAVENLAGAAGRAVSGPVKRTLGALGDALEGNAGRMAAADARMAAEGSTAAPAMFGALPDPGGAGRIHPTVEALQEQLDTATSAWQRARDAGDERMAALAREHAVALESDLADARNARRALEPTITADVGPRVESLPLAAETADTLSGAGSRLERASPGDFGVPMSQEAPDINLNATAGALPAAARIGADRFGAVNRVLSEGLAGGVGGAVIEQGRNPDEDPRTAAARGFAAGAVGFPVATRLARGAARLAGAGRDVGGGARIALGDVPPSRVGQQGLPGVEHPPYTKPAIPDVSETPNRAPVLGDVPPSAIRRPGLPGFEEPPPRPLAEFADAVLGPAGPPLPPSGARDPRGQGYLPSLEPGPVGRLRQALEPWLNRAGIVRYAGMLSDTAGHVQNLEGNLAGQLADLAETPLMVAQDVARVGAMRAIGRPAQREVFLSEMPARLKGMAAGARAGLGRAAEIMKTGTDPAEATKLDQGPRGFGTDIPRLAPKGSRTAGIVDAAFEGPLRALGAADAVFRGAAGEGHLAAEALAEATRKNGGRAPTADQIHLAMADKGVRDRADDLAARSVLQEDRKLTTWYRDQVVGKAPPEAKALIQAVIPWVRTPYNVIAQGLGMTDVGALAGVINDVRKGTAPRQVQRRVARAAIGTAIGTWAAGEYADGTITGPYPSEQAERSTLPPGWRPWSRKVEAPNGDAYYLPLAALGPFAVPAVYQILRAEAIKKGADPFSKELLGDVAMGIGRYAEQNTFLEGLGAISKVFDERSGDANIGRLVEQTAASYAPHVLGFGGFGRELQRAMGMPARDPENAAEAVLATNPLTAGMVRPRQDVLGREESLGIGGPAALVARGGVENDDPVIAAFRDAGQALPSKGPSALTDPGTKQSVPLDADQRAAWERAFGDAVQQRWAQAGYASSARALNDVKQRAAEDARRAVLGR